MGANFLVGVRILCWVVFLSNHCFLASRTTHVASNSVITASKELVFRQRFWTGFCYFEIWYSREKLSNDRLCCKVELILEAVTHPEVHIANLGDIRQGEELLEVHWQQKEATTSVSAFGPPLPHTRKTLTDQREFIWEPPRLRVLKQVSGYEVMCEERQRALEIRRYRRNLLAVHNYLMGRCREHGVTLFSKGQEASDTWEISTWYKEKLFQCKGGWTVELRAHGGCRISSLGNIQNLTGHSPEHPDLVGCVLSSTLDMEILRGPF